MATVTKSGILPPDVELVESDGEPLDTAWHRDEINLLVDSVRYALRERQNYFVGGNMFIYFSLEHARNRDFRGPDFFYVNDVAWNPLRPYWVVWEEGGRYPDVIIELASASTEEEDRTTKKVVYERTFRTPEYFLFDPGSGNLEGWRLTDDGYQPISPNEKGRLWCMQLQHWLGVWDGAYQGCESRWLRFFDQQGRVARIASESEQARAEAEYARAEAEHRRAETERQRAEAAEAELTRLKAMLAEQEAKQRGK